jgi:hypothetical protein
VGALEHEKQAVLSQGVLPDRSLDISFFFFVQKWKILMRPGDKLKIEALAGRVLEAAKVFRSSGNAVSDVGFV